MTSPRRRHQKRHLDGAGPVPLHRQLQDVLRRELASGRYRPGDRIPSERVLCETYGVSRTTVRQTVNDLVHEGRLVRVPAKGTFVPLRKIEQDLARVSWFSESVKAAGRAPDLRLLTATRIPAEEAVRLALELSADDDVVRLDLIGRADGEPIVRYRVHLPAPIGDSAAEALQDGQKKGTVSFRLLLQHLRDVHGLRAARVVQSFEAVAADDGAAAVLGLRRGSPVIASSRTVFTDAGDPVEYDEIVFRGDRYRFTVRRPYPLD